MRKIYPLYIISFFIIMPLVLYNTFNFTNNIILSFFKLLLKIILYLTMTQSLTGITDFSHAFNGVAWFLSCLFFCYICSPLIYKTIKKISNRRKMIGIFMLIFAMAIFVFFLLKRVESLNIVFLNMKINDLAYGHSISRIWLFMLGMCISKIYLINSINISSVVEKIILYAFLTYYLICDRLNLNMYLSYFLDILFCCLFIIGLINGKTTFVKNISSINCANYNILSMIIFLMHYPINQYIGFFMLYNVDLFKNEICYVMVFIIEILLDVLLVKFVYKKYNKISKIV